MRSLFLLTVLITTITFAGAQNAANSEFTKELKQFRKDYKKAMLADERSPFESKKELKSVTFFEPNENLKVKCLFIRTYEEKPFEMSTYSGDTKPYVKYGDLLFEIPGDATYRISVYQSLKGLKIPLYKDHLFVPFKDLTNGESTYGGGRYINLTLADIQQGIVYLDFNKAYNPWCAYGDGFSCPVPPKENHLNIKIEAGEKDYPLKEEDVAGS